MGANNKRKTIKQFKNEVYDLVKDEYTILSNEYINNKTKIKIKHNKCNHEYEVMPNKFLLGRRCPNCNGGVKNSTYKKSKPSKYRTHEEFLEELNLKYNGEFKVIEGKFTRMIDKIKVKHSCGYEFETTPKNLLNYNGYSGCPMCSRNKKRTHEEFVELVNNKFPNKYDIIGKYTNNRLKIEVLHKKCNKSWMISPSNLLAGYQCPYCSMFEKESKGEYAIRNYLENSNIEFIKEYKFKDCKDTFELPFDFFIKINNKIKVIEFDGIQHFEPIEFFGGEEHFRTVKKHDKIKDDFCKENNIDILRIPYIKLNNINEILDTWVKQ